MISSPSNPTPHSAAVAAPSAPPAPAGVAALPVAPARGRALYLLLLAWSFSIFNTVRIVTYLPTVWAIHESARSDQHSLLTWFAWTGANLTMALWLYEQAARRPNRAALVNLCNAAMCLLTCGVILYYR